MPSHRHNIYTPSHRNTYAKSLAHIRQVTGTHTQSHWYTYAKSQAHIRQLTSTCIQHVEYDTQSYTVQGVCMAWRNLPACLHLRTTESLSCRRSRWPTLFHRNSTQPSEPVRRKCALIGDLARNGSVRMRYAYFCLMGDVVFLSLVAFEVRTHIFNVRAYFAGHHSRNTPHGVSHTSFWVTGMRMRECIT